MSEHVYNSLGEWTHCTFSKTIVISFLTSIEWNAQDGLSIICTDLRSERQQDYKSNLKI